MRRRNRKQPTSLMTAVALEFATMVGIVAVAQPTWTRNLVDHVTASLHPSTTLHMATELAVPDSPGAEAPAMPLSQAVLPPPLPVWQAAGWAE